MADLGADWIKVSPHSGTGDAKLSVSVDANTWFGERSASVPIVSVDGSLRAVVNVTQPSGEPAGDYLVTESSAPFVLESSSTTVLLLE